uniref:TRP C-terminal domain-containing protein n=1 Tax=Globisporangium ultimum (strain ATCC 200006 / CBS 805.95 / DAOM BR144) TaxID=431595 RepID=K3X5Z4_GLOUD
MVRQRGQSQSLKVAPLAQDEGDDAQDVAMNTSLVCASDAEQQQYSPSPNPMRDSDKTIVQKTTLVVHARCRHVSRFWVEKAVILCDAMQIYALIWQLAQPWPWPTRWLRWTRWVNAFNLDVFSFRAQGAAMGATSQSFSLWGEMEKYWAYALVWASLPFWGWAVTRIVDLHSRKSGHRDFLVVHMQWENALLQLLQLLYLPIGLAALRLVNCDSSGIVSVDPIAMGGCWSARHSAAVLIITICLAGSFLASLPWILHNRIHMYLPHSSDEKHERFLKAKELEFVLGTSETYLEISMPLYASFRRHSVRSPVDMCILKLVLLLVFAILRSPFPRKTNQGCQGTFFVAVMLAFAIKRTLRPPFRVQSSAQLAKIIDWALVANGVFVLLSANGVRSALTVATTMTSCLLLVNVCVLIVLGVALLRSVHQWRNRFKSRHMVRECWPTHERMGAVIDYEMLLRKWVDAIQQAKDVTLKALLVTPSMRSPDELGAVLRNLEACRDEALDSDHLLAEQLSELLLFVNELYVEALSTNPFHNTKISHEELAQLSQTLNRRDDHRSANPVQTSSYRNMDEEQYS